MRLLRAEGHDIREQQLSRLEFLALRQNEFPDKKKSLSSCFKGTWRPAVLYTL